MSRRPAGSRDGSANRPLFTLAALLLVLSGGYVIFPLIHVDDILNPDRISRLVRTAGPLAPVLFMLLMAMAVVISPIPSLPLDLAAGATFGVVAGTVYAVIGAEIGAILSFLIGRALGREALSRLFRTNVTFCERCSDRHLAVFVFLSRLLPIFSFDLISYGAGLTNMSLRTFALATLLGMIIPTFMMTFAGSRVVSGEWLVLVLGLVMVAGLLLIPRLVVRYHTARWVRLLRGDMPVAARAQVPRDPLIAPVVEVTPRCDSCGGTVD